MLLFALAWYASGILGSVLALEFGFRRNRDMSLDIDAGDIIFGLFVAIIGPLNLIAGIIFLVAYGIGGVIDTRRTVFKRHSH